MIKSGAGKAAFRLQEMMRAELDRLIYSTPESPNYHRTRTLYRATYAARPGGNHSRDHEAAKAGVDLKVTEPVAGGVVRLKGFVAEVEIGSWANYAWHVHEGHGLGYRVPKPFAVRPMEAAGRILSEELTKSLAAGLASIKGRSR